MADAASESQPADTRRGDGAGRRRHAESVTGVVDVGPCAAALHAHGAGGGIDMPPPHARQVNDQTAVACSQPTAVVAAATHRDEHVLVPGEEHGLDDIRDVGALDDVPGPLVDHPVVDLAG